MNMAPEELKKYRGSNYKTVIRFAKNNPERAKIIANNGFKKRREANTPGYLKSYLYSKLYAFKELKQAARENGFTPSEELMEAAKSLNILSLKIGNYEKSNTSV